MVLVYNSLSNSRYNSGLNWIAGACFKSIGEFKKDN